MVIVTILGILASVAYLAVANVNAQSLQVSCRTEFKTVETAAAAYELQIGSFPTDLTTLGAPVGGQGPWLKELPSVFTPGVTPSIDGTTPYGFAVDVPTRSIAVGTLRSNGATADSGTPLSDGSANCAYA